MFRVLVSHLVQNPRPPHAQRLAGFSPYNDNGTTTNKKSGDDQGRDFRGKTPADVIGESKEVEEGKESNEELYEVIRRTLAGGMDLAQDAVLAADEVCGGFWVAGGGRETRRNGYLAH